MSYDDFDIERARELREKTTDEVRKQARKGLLAILVPSLLLVGLFCFSLVQWGSASDPAMRNFYVILGFLAIAMHWGLWVTYGLDARILVLMKEIKQLRLDYLSHQETPIEQATGGAESLSTRASGLISPKTVSMAAVALSVFGATFGLIAHNALRGDPETFGGQEVAEVHVTADGAFRVHSRISILKCADNIASIPLHIPQPGATLESVSVDGRRIPFAPVPDEEDTYTIMPGLPENALKHVTLEVVWSPQEDDIRVENGVRYFDLPLLGIIPISAYTANVVIDDGAPYQFAYGEKYPPSTRALNQFWTKRSDGSFHHDRMGTCGIAVKAFPENP